MKQSLSKRHSVFSLAFYSLALAGVSLMLGACSDAGQSTESTENQTDIGSSSRVEVSDSDAHASAQEQQTEQASQAMNTLSEEEREQGYQLLFDGKTTEGWRGFNRDDFPPNWVVENGTLHMVGIANMSDTQKENRGDIIYDETYSDFILKLEWKISPAGNSGIFYLGEESEEYDFIWKTAPEMQILDNDGHPDASKGKDGNRQAGSLYDLVPAEPQNAAPVGQWNQVEIHVSDRKVKHIQNGEVVVEYEMDTPEWNAMIAVSKFPALNENWAQVPESGYIGLQDHSDPVWFRNIRIKKL
uniref:3-keto-disaccharide hydrolase n=1 Tax=Ningiella ruwaisensis TaxID=2364274 RepID=UPI0019D5E75E|nr:DUF1080 domain-containing protein [Ningiella ruwaisensis]